MKNIFKFMSMALVASALMVACGDKNENNEDTTPSTPVTPTTVKTVNFDGSEWTAAGIYMEDYSSYGLYYWSVEGGSNTTDPMTFGYSGNNAGRTYELDNQSSGTAGYYYWMYLRNDDDYTEAMASDSTMKEYPNWQPYTAINNFQAFDANAKTVTMTVNAQVFDLAAYNQGEQIIKQLTVTLKDAAWEEVAE